MSPIPPVWIASALACRWQFLPRFGAGVALCLLLGACAEQQIRRGADDALARGAYEESVRLLREGVKASPESVVLRAALLKARQEGVEAVLRDFRQRQMAGDLAAAQQMLDRAQGWTRRTPGCGS